jgi:hypothetical protein
MSHAILREPSIESRTTINAEKNTGRMAEASSPILTDAGGPVSAASA